jgi:hypothetical protein
LFATVRFAVERQAGGLTQTQGSERRTMLPTTNTRNDMLQQCLGWIGEHYDEGDDPETTWRQAVLSTLNIPALDRTLIATDWMRSDYDRALEAYREVIGLGLHYDVHGWPDTTEAHVAKDAWALMMGIHQPDLSREQVRSSHLEAMVRGLIHWLTFVDGGLRDATTALDRALKGT